MRCALFLIVLLSSPGWGQVPKVKDLFELSLDELSKIRVFTASRQDEPVRESPVPITVIDAETIERMGARNLKEVLITLVPGMTFSQDHNEVNVAMRGVYASSQQKFLIMVEGHRLNTRAFSEANPDFSIGLDKIKQIEVLRGPASSLYGNVALTAVVNIILKKGAEVGGGHVSAGGGSYGQRRGSLLFGNEWSGLDILIWGQYYRADGEEVTIPPEKNIASDQPRSGTVILDRFDDKPSHDFGIMLRHKGVSLLVENRRGHAGEPFSGGGPAGQIYDLDAIPLFRGVGPGLQSQSTHTSLKYQHKFGRISMDLRGYFDDSIIRGGLVVDAEEPLFASPYWHENNYGGILQVSLPYAHQVQKGSLLLGYQRDQMRLISSYVGVGRGDAFLGQNPLMEPGKESIDSFFFQVKHHFGERWLFNGGLRHDEKNRRDMHLDNNAPRLALLYFLNDQLDFRLSYAKSFVDAPYWYRFNALPSYRGGTMLKPEHLRSWQATLSYRLNYHALEMNVFRNHLSDFVFRDTSVALDDVATPIYRNAGVLKSQGIEWVYNHHRPQWRLQANLTWQHALEARDYGEFGGEIDNIPELVGNIRFDQRLHSNALGLIDVGMTLRYISSQRSPIMLPAYGYENLDNRVGSVWLTDANMRLNRFLGTPVDFSLAVRNLSDEGHEQGGSVQFPYPQPGRWFSFDLSLRF